MNLLPVAGNPAGVAVTDPATYTSGDFTALLSMLVGAASTTLPIDLPSGEPALTANGADGQLPVPDFAAQPAELPDGASFPSGSVSPSVPATPAAPGAPAMPATPATPARPGNSAVPATPAAPATPSGPAMPGGPGTPAVPAAPAMPAAPATPETPSGRTTPNPSPGLSTPAPTAAPQPPETSSPERPTLETAELQPTPGSGSPADRIPAGTVPKQDIAHPAVARSLNRGRDLPNEDADQPITFLSDQDSPTPIVPRIRSERAAAPHHTPVPAPAAAPDTPGQLRPATPEVEKAGDLPVSKVAVNPKASQGSAHPAVPLVAATRSEALVPVDAPPSAPAAPVSVPEQIVSAVVPLHGRGDGRHEVTLELRPDDLGTIRVEVSVDQQTVHLTLHAAEPATGRLLSAALHELRAALTDAGLTAGQLGVGVDSGGGAGQRRTFTDQGDADPHRSGRPGRPADDTAAEPVSIRRRQPAAAGRLDLFL